MEKEGTHRSIEEPRGEHGPWGRRRVMIDWRRVVMGEAAKGGEVTGDCMEKPSMR